MKEYKVLFKGILGGLEVHVDPNMNLDILLKELQAKLESSKSFFKGTHVNLSFVGREFSSHEKDELINSISHQIKTESIEFNGPFKEEDEKVSEKFYGTEEGMARFFHGTIRNGQRLDYKGNIIVMGDVNPGAEIVAGGNIIVLGNLRGMAHAGIGGDMGAVVVAFCLQPTQLRIGHIITRSPEGEMEKPDYPEIAYIKGDNMVIEPYMSSKQNAK